MLIIDLIFHKKSFKKLLYSIYAVILMALSFLNVTPGITDIPVAPSDFVPIMRFTIASDVHLKVGTKFDEQARLEKMVQKSYAIAENDASYNKLDAVCFAGDITDSGDEPSFRLFKELVTRNLKGDTEFLPMMGNHDFGTYEDGARDVFSTVFDEYGPDFNVNLNGFHIIATSKNGDSEMRDLKHMSWFNQQLKDAKKENPDYPIFVINHEHPFNTVYGSTNWGDLQLNAVLASYPQIIDFSGHSHYPINDPRSIWQGSYTALGTGTLSYFELEVDGEGGLFPANNRTAATMYVVEANAQGSVKIRCYDLISESFIGETYFIETPSKISSHAYNTINRRSKSSAPVFDAGAKITAAKLPSGETEISFPSAISTDGQIVHNYRVEARMIKGDYIYEDAYISDYYMNPSSTSFKINLGVLEAGKSYSVSIKAENAYAKRSEALKLEFVAQ